MMLKTHTSCLLAVLVSLAGCSSTLFESKKIDYKSQTNRVPTLEIPPDLTQPSRDERYVVPDINPKGTATYSGYNAERTGQTATAANSEVLPSVNNMKVERDGSHRWLSVQMPADKLWPLVKQFWQENGFLIASESMESGVMETDWAENRAKLPQDAIRATLGKLLDSLYSTSERDKFRTRLEVSSEAGYTDIFISHRGMEEVYSTQTKDQTVWQPRQADPELEAEFLRRLMVRLGADEKRATALAAVQPAAERARLEKEGGQASRVTVFESFDRAWRRVGLALDRVGFTVEDRDRNQGIYYVRYVDPDADNVKKDDGMLSKLAFWRSKNDPSKKVQYRVRVSGSGTESSVQVLTTEGGVDTSETARKIMGLLYEQLK